MVKFLTKFENRCIKIDWVKLDSYHQIYQFRVIYFFFSVLGVRCDVDIFKLAASAPSINREVYDKT